MVHSGVTLSLHCCYLLAFLERLGILECQLSQVMFFFNLRIYTDRYLTIAPSVHHSDKHEKKYTVERERMVGDKYTVLIVSLLPIVVKLSLFMCDHETTDFIKKNWVHTAYSFFPHVVY